MTLQHLLDRPSVPADDFLPLPPRADRLSVAHGSTALRDESPAGTPPVPAVVVHHVARRWQRSFAAYLVAERLHIPVNDSAARRDRPERCLLHDFYCFVAE